eukprot:31564-Pelagococcus_subviridis.AAC.10
MNFSNRPRRALAQRGRERVVRAQERETRRGDGDERERVAKEVEHEREHEPAEVVGAVVVHVALHPARELALGLRRRELREELRDRARARVPVHLGMGKRGRRDFWV